MWKILGRDGRRGSVLCRRCVCDAVSPGPKGDFGVAGDGAVCQGHFEEADVVDDGRGDAGDEEADGGDEEHEDADAGASD